ncbi:MAG: ribbon-helix-helix protein, CopG family [Gammaproteobacteria bacterium]|nr:ribbon-helix-helix protein, CopG family [Gammaproteobacteria bacterium]MYD76694.1 ribbon-helix-helix protein, CopG family [Gammaproteobacteria bacterium]MYJ52612.1 ribbon-helix-helix protein, CopG family [Gammaproteobacteria bacterium]
MPTIPVTVKLDKDVQIRMKVLAEACGKSSHWMMREAIRQYVEHGEKREAYRQDGLRVWAAYEQTGLHVSHAEADAWLAQLANGGNPEPPACHL